MRKLGAHIHLDSLTQDVAAKLSKLGGAKTILATVTNGKAISSVIAGLSTRGKLVVVGVGMHPIQVSTLDLILGSQASWATPSAPPSIPGTRWPSARLAACGRLSRPCRWSVRPKRMTRCCGTRPASAWC